MEKEMYHRVHVWNLVAKEIRDTATNILTHEDYATLPRDAVTGICAGFTGLAVNFAKRFERDCESFDPEYFLDNCTPDDFMVQMRDYYHHVAT